MKIGIVGSGSWGTALAFVANRANNDTCLFTRKIIDAEQITRTRENSINLPGILIPNEIEISADLTKALAFEILILAVPAQTVREVCYSLKKLGLSKEVIIVVVAKGIEENSLKLMSEVVNDVLPLNSFAILSGPNYASLVAKDLPTITSISAKDAKLANLLSKMLATKNFRIYPNDDIIGTQVFGAAKNVLAIAAGIVRGKELGENAEAAVVSRGIYEICLLNKALGGKDETLLSPAGVGDIYLTCSSLTSRNTTYGVSLAREQNFSGKLVEGYFTVKSINDLAKKYSIAMPIFESVYQISQDKRSLDKIIDHLLSRELKVI